MLHIETIVKNFNVDRTSAKAAQILTGSSSTKKIVAINKNKQLFVYEISNGESLQPLMMSDCGRVFTSPEIHGYVTSKGDIVLPKAVMYLNA